MTRNAQRVPLACHINTLPRVLGNLGPFAPWRDSPSWRVLSQEKLESFSTSSPCPRPNHPTSHNGGAGVRRGLGNQHIAQVETDRPMPTTTLKHDRGPSGRLLRLRGAFPTVSSTLSLSLFQALIDR
ncbi:hypothetical protein CGRA01v4_12506 [Colletotrichum graminicola]|nr:hypothetical protein CGRA01v4_12506 [Colletotrichum graminicola]